MLNLLKQLLPERFKRQIKHSMGFQDMETRLRNLKRSGFKCSGAVDVGAYAGEWALQANDIFFCPVIMIEPQPNQRDKLLSLAKKLPFELESIGLSKEQGILKFFLQETNSRIAIDNELKNSTLPTINVPVDRLDLMLKRHTSHCHNLLKIDVQGFELDVLMGAGASLSQFEVVILEVSIIRIGPVPIFSEVLNFMASCGYRLYDFLPMYYRPLDGSLWQGDAFFVRNDSKLVENNRWN